MKLRIVLGLAMLGTLLYAQEPRKLWVSVQYRGQSERVLFIQDLETGTRCYAITSDKLTDSGYGIACVKAGK